MPIDVAAGLSALKAAAQLAKALREAAKSGTVAPDEFAGRVAEIYDYVIDSKEAVVAAQERLAQVEAENERLRTYRFHHSVYWRVMPDGSEDGPFCPICVAGRTDMRLMMSRGIPKDESVWHFSCPAGHLPEGRGREHVYAVPRSLVPEGRYVLPT
jgi:hypothetical protein